MSEDKNETHQDQDEAETTAMAGGDGDNQSVIDVNGYATRKTLAQGLLDIALLTSNASQLKYVLQLGSAKDPLCVIMVVLIAVSMILQVFVGVFFLRIMRFDIKKPRVQKQASHLNNVITVQVFVISALNVVISSMGIDHVAKKEGKELGLAH